MNIWYIFSQLGKEKGAYTSYPGLKAQVVKQNVSLGAKVALCVNGLLFRHLYSQGVCTGKPPMLKGVSSIKLLKSQRRVRSII